MPPRSSISTLPKEVQKELNAKLLKSSFSDYDALAIWLQEEGFEISRSAVGRHGQKFKERLESIKKSTEMAKLLASEVGDDEGAMTDAMVRLLQDKLFNLILELETDPKKINVTSLTRSVADLVRASVNQKKWMSEMKSKIRTAANEITKIAKSSGLTAARVEEINNKILGITR